ALLARLFYAPPDEALLQALAASEDLDADEGDIAAAWRDLARAAGAADPAAVREEYDGAFIGVGKSPVTLYTSAYSIRYANEVPLVGLKAALAALGLGRRDDISEPEDHFAGLCDAMRHLIAVQKRELTVQKQFFARWIWPTAEPLCSAIEKSESTSFYRV